MQASHSFERRLRVSGVREFFRLLLPTEPPACRSCKETICAYIDAEFELGAAATHFPTIKAHLGECQSCQQFYEDSNKLELMERNGSLDEPPLKHHFDFSYLLWEVVKRTDQGVKLLSEELRILIRRGTAIFYQLPVGAVAPPPTLRTRSIEKQVPLVIRPDKEANIKLCVVASASSHDQAFLTVRVENIKPSRTVRRAKVTLNDRQAMRLQGGYTGFDGLVSFSNVTWGDYLIIVKYKKRQWQLPIGLGGERVV